VSAKYSRCLWRLTIHRTSRSKADDGRDSRISRKGGFITLALVGVLVFLLIPWQVAFLACYLIHFQHCATIVSQPAIRKQARTHSENEKPRDTDAYNQKLLFLLVMTWCLPVVAPVLAVWVRTLATAGLTTPFDGDHNPLNVLSFVALVYVSASTRGGMCLRRHR
jgi:GPI inositol-deacylase